MDNHLVETNYYRLRMNDLDGSSKMSEVVLVRYHAVRQNVKVMNNPFGNSITLALDKSSNNTKLQLVNTLGAVVAEQSAALQAGQFTWHLPAALPKGSYVLKVIADGQLFTSKLVHQ